jgi:hypothetical protein
MNTYVVAYCSLHTGTLEQTVVEAVSDYAAACIALKIGTEVAEDFKDLNDLEEFVFDSDGYLNVIKI